MLSKDEINKTVEMLIDRDAYFFHSCQLIDFKTYLLMGGIPTRELLENKKMLFSTYKSDDNLKSNNGTDKIILKFVDFGNQFFHKINTIPNPFGPIVLQIKPDVLLKAQEVTVYKKSMRSKDFDENNTINNVNDIDQLFKYDSNVPFPEKRQIRDELADYSGYEYDQAPEIVCTFENDILPIEFVTLASVDQYVIKRRQLSHWSDEMRYATKFTFPTQRRYCPRAVCVDICADIYSNIVEEIPTLENIKKTSQKVEVQKWCSLLMETGKEEQFNLFVEYLRNWTFLPFHKDETLLKSEAKPPQEDDILENLSPEEAMNLLKKLSKDNKVANQIKKLAKQ